MSFIRDLFRPVKGIDADDAADLMREWAEGSYTLLDVRQPREYENTHIPGARLIPVGQLNDRMGELDPKKPVIVY
jgi:rhodanese-related sulfurtransferase